jgi:exonuclease SbcC
LIAAGEELDRKRGAQIARQAELTAEQGKRAALLQEAESAGLGLDALLGASHTLADLGDWLARRAVELARLEEEQRAAAGKAESLAAARAELEAVDERMAAIRAEVESGRAERDAAQRALDQARQRLEGARGATLQRDQRRSAVGEREKTLVACRKEVEAAKREVKSASALLKTAELALTANQRSHAAAHAAAGVAAGEPCPVCERKLPASWKAPVAPDLRRAQDAVTAARANERASQERVTKLEVRAGELEARVSEDRTALEGAEEALRAAISALRELAGRKADPQSDGEAVLEPLARQVAGSAQRFEEAERRRHEHEKDRGERYAVVTRLAADVGAAGKQLESGRQRLGREGEDAKRRLAGLPQSLRPAGLEAKPLAAARTRAEQALETAKQNRARDQELSKELHVVQSALVEIDDRRAREVLRPTHAVARGLDDLRRALELLAGETQGEAPPKSDAEGPGEVAAWARELAECRDRLLRQVATSAKQVTAKLAAARKAGQDALAQAGVESETALARRSTEVGVTLQRKAEDLEQARGQIALARELDRRIGGAAPLVEALRELARLLTDGKFIGHVVDRKQQSLLAVASKLLGEMTKDRYGFSQEFQVVDRLTGEPRSVMTLSGGETFLASLALALGLVELAGREGGRLDALFLDEGFGSLDSNALAEALDALHDQAAKGRLVAVISHLHAVAENIERVLLVTRTPTGSRAQWLSDAERAQLVDDEATGLLS